VLCWFPYLTCFHCFANARLVSGPLVSYTEFIFAMAEDFGSLFQSIDVAALTNAPPILPQRSFLQKLGLSQRSINYETQLLMKEISTRQSVKETNSLKKKGHSPLRSWFGLSLFSSGRSTPTVTQDSHLPEVIVTNQRENDIELGPQGLDSALVSQSLKTEHQPTSGLLLANLAVEEEEPVPLAASTTTKSRKEGISTFDVLVVDKASRFPMSNVLAALPEQSHDASFSYQEASR
jgi:hypothetical protein